MKVSDKCSIVDEGLAKERFPFCLKHLDLTHPPASALLQASIHGGGHRVLLRC